MRQEGVEGLEGDGTLARKCFGGKAPESLMEPYVTAEA